MAKPTYQDAMLMLQAAQWSAALGFQEAIIWLWSDQFVPDYGEFVKKYPPGSDGRLSAAKVLVFFETLGTLYKQGLFNGDLLFDWLAVSMVWGRIKGYALGVRQEAGNARLYENFEALANASAAYDTKPQKQPAKAKRQKR